MRHHRISLMVAAMAVFVELGTAAVRAGEIPKRFNLGEVYLIQARRPTLSVAEILRAPALNGTSAWTQTEPLKGTISIPLQTSHVPYCFQGRQYWYARRIDLIGERGYTREIRGVHELPDILNRPLSGQLYSRTEDIRITQLRQSISQACADCRSDQRIVACVLTKIVIDPKLRFQGFQTAEQVTADAKWYREQLGLDAGGVEGPDKDGQFVVPFFGELTYEAVFRGLKDTEPRLGSDRIFYLNGKLSAKIFASGTFCGLLMHDD